MLNTIFTIIVMACAITVLVCIIYMVYKGMGREIALSLSGAFFFGGLSLGFFVGFLDKFITNLTYFFKLQPYENPFSALPLLILAIICGLIAFANAKKLIRLLKEYY